MDKSGTRVIGLGLAMMVGVIFSNFVQNPVEAIADTVVATIIIFLTRNWFLPNQEPLPGTFHDGPRKGNTILNRIRRFAGISVDEA